MKFGQFFLLEQFPGRSESDVYRDALEQIQVAEELGYHTAWLAEHRFSPYGIMPDTLLFGATIAARTTRIRIGTAVVVLPFHHPILLAEQTAMLDLLSNGRFDFGVGRGYQAKEYSSFNMDMDESRERFEETLRIIQGLWTTDNYSYQGKYFTIKDATLKPKPVQRPGPRIYAAVMRTPSSFKYALDNHYNILMGNPYAADPGVSEALETFNRLKIEQGYPEDVDIWALAHCFVHEDDDLAREIPRVSWESAVNSLVTYGTPRRADGTISKDYASHRDFGEEFANRARTDPGQKDKRFNRIVGDPAHCRARIAGLQAAGVPNLILWFNNGGGIPQSEVLKSMELFAKEVMPEFAD